MIRTILLRPEARQELLETYAWYESQQAGLGERFKADVDECFAQIQSAPRGYPVELRDIRRARLHVFRHYVFYAPVGSEIVIYAVVHTSRDPRYWRMALRGRR